MKEILSTEPHRMITKPYLIETVDRVWAFDSEEMGSKKKFWYRHPQREQEWLFKYPHPGTGEHWAERVAASVATRFGIGRAEVRLALCENEKGSAAKSFVGPNEALFHGNQILAGQLDLYNPKCQFRQNQHTLFNIFTSLEKIFKKPEVSEKQKMLMAKYMVFDAIIGNTDRHHENWGILVETRGNNKYGVLAPSFDHASSLGRELENERRERILRECRVGRYSERARGGIYWDEADGHAVSPLKLVRNGVAMYPNIFRGALQACNKLHRKHLKSYISKVPDDWMDPVAKLFALELMLYNLGELGRLGRE